MSSIKNLNIAIDSSLSYCSITIFKDEKIIWNKEKKCNFGHEKYLSILLDKMAKELKVTPKNFSSLYLNYGPARFTCIRSCHSLMKGYFIHHPIKIYAYTIFEHFYLGLKKNHPGSIGCIIDTNRRDIGLQAMNSKGKAIGNFQTVQINEDLINKLDDYDVIMGNGINKIKDMDGFLSIQKKCLYPFSLKSKFLMKNHYTKKPLKNIPRIIYPYSPI